ncbi:ATP-grasp fold amidoligase family protein (plasmid) [Klebsiella pneumoniae]|uniref:Glycosyl transferase n=5 Tax=Klebsiella/Raoultella group TaxID=2890311 RepID=A0A2U7XWW3_KLEPN|nr:MULTISPECIES: ATP-grasp fold amidoligase family protein [Enterobacteriaceae]AVX52229.1 hypothetical protein pKP91-00066 [Klebsiella pneumoniae]AZZ88831.1 Glycosyltransferase [Raoultella ornithinolytica]EIX9211800.1 glycosyl transferase [Klebsiella pneumoniae]EIX9212195.1 glycosyl transferase [Klebsiella pneumoniae]MBA8742656.1 glycosyl transferase [Klebsiella pneumoniae]
MCTLKNTLKYIEYKVKIIRFYIVSDACFHAGRLCKIYGGHVNIEKPVTLNEKICHRMIYDHNPIYTLISDKLAVRNYVHLHTDKIKTVPLLGVYSSFDEIDFNRLPDQFVLKCNHDSGSTIICNNKQLFNVSEAGVRLTMALNRNMYYSTREWQYKNISPVILCEEYIDLFYRRDRKVTPEVLRLHCFHGVARFIEADFRDAAGNEYINVYDIHWQRQPFTMEFPDTPYEVPEPELLSQAISASQELYGHIDYCRVDLMLLSDTIYFSEITLSPRRGKLLITPSEWDTMLGNLWRYPPL